MLDLVVQYAFSGAVEVESAGQSHKAYHQNDLHNKRRLQHCLTGVLRADIRLCSCESGRSVRGNDLNAHTQGNEGGGYAARVNGRVIRDVVEYATQNEEISTLIYWSGIIEDWSVAYLMMGWVLLTVRQGEVRCLRYRRQYFPTARMLQ